MTPIEIPVSRKRLQRGVFGAILFITIGLWFLIAAPVTGRGLMRDATSVRIAGGITLVAFAYFGYESYRKLRQPGLNLRINDEGITDESGNMSLGFIPWQDVTGINPFAVKNQKMVSIYVRNPDEHIDRQKNSMQRRLMQLNKRLYQTPLIISASLLDIPFEQLLSLLQTGLAEHGVHDAGLPQS